MNLGIGMSHNNRGLISIVIAIISAILVACSDEDFVMNSSFINSDSYALYTDQVPIELATFRLDSVQTSNQNTIWVGKVNKPVIGDIYSESYMKITEPSSYDWENKEKFDSITIVLRHTGEYQGDTTQSITLDVHRLATMVEFTENETEFYNKREFRDSSSIGTFTFVPRPNSRPRVRFRLNDDFGQEIVDFIKNNSSTESSLATQLFYQWLGGIKITFQGEPSVQLAFEADSMTITLHSHLPLFERYEVERTLTMADQELQYNRVWNENIESPYDEIEERYQQVSETDGGLHSVMFEGLGYYTRVNFPSLDEVVAEGNYAHVVKATLKLYCERDSYDKHDFPSTFYLSEINSGNVLENMIYNSYGYLISATLVNNILDEDQVYYYADITYYINTILEQEYIDDTDGLCVLWSSGMSPTNYYFMLFNGHGVERYKSILEIYYYNYDREDR